MNRLSERKNNNLFSPLLWPSIFLTWGWFGRFQLGQMTRRLDVGDEFRLKNVFVAYRAKDRRKLSSFAHRDCMLMTREMLKRTFLLLSCNLAISPKI
jgi:hypothetical protein